MSKFISLSCPMCGAKLETTENKKFFVCEYCDHKHIISKNDSLSRINNTTWSCTNCNTENPIGSEFCYSCGTKIAENCPECNNKSSLLSKYCQECGANKVEAYAILQIHTEALFQDSLKQKIASIENEIGSIRETIKIYSRVKYSFVSFNREINSIKKQYSAKMWLQLSFLSIYIYLGYKILSYFPMPNLDSDISKMKFYFSFPVIFLLFIAAGIIFIDVALRNPAINILINSKRESINILEKELAVLSNKTNKK